jgi:hypothetical protein
MANSMTREERRAVATVAVLRCGWSIYVILELNAKYQEQLACIPGSIS